MMETRTSSRCRSGLRRRRGFTLTEIMISLGVLVVGMGMAAGAFHAGIQNHTVTVDEIRRTMIGENAVAIAKARLRSDVNLTTEWQMLSRSEMGNFKLGEQDLQYPVGSGSRHRFLIFGCRPDNQRNVFEFLVILYDITDTSAGQEQIDIEFIDVADVNILDHESGASLARPSLGRGQTIDSVMPIGSMLYVPDLDEPFVTVTNHLQNQGFLTDALLERRVTPRTGDYSILKVMVGGQLKAAALEIRGIYRGRTALRPGSAN